ncbi:hypothetical protein K2173_027283 [Erythroxylum novogranatense]|uniref:Pectinesterase inhibitor domain-containing protein n=1 Tax=Erythroxylum novogranatense TaxID=1862640 RepID=A0AAV8TYL6_9ROSI|nr:hypothetical protein K2173_027283 [Erythroxylum novogranatense]
MSSSSSYHVLPFLLSLLLFMTSIPISLASTTPTDTYTNYLITACNSTTYPKLCYKSLSPYTSTIKTNDRKLCVTALKVTLQAATNSSSIVKSVSKQKGLSKTEVNTIKDCLDEVGDCISEIKQCIRALSKANSSDSVEDFKTWASAALTDETTCTDEFVDVKVSAAVKSKITTNVINLSRLTSNALALLNRLN